MGTGRENSQDQSILQPCTESRILHRLRERLWAYLASSNSGLAALGPASTNATSMDSEAKKGSRRLGGAVPICSVEQQNHRYGVIEGVRHSVLLAMFRCSGFEAARMMCRLVGPLYCVTAILGVLLLCNIEDRYAAEILPVERKQLSR